MALRAWSDCPIRESGEPLVCIPAELHRLEPHPYAALGAPYGLDGDPFRLRQGVISRLLRAQSILQETCPGRRLAIFDAWRPLVVQAFMVEHAIDQECGSRGLNRHDMNHANAVKEVESAVGRFWAPPSSDPLTPPPHSTGAAVDLTFADGNGLPMAMGGEIDAIGDISHPDYYAAQASSAPHSMESLWHQRRSELAEVMLAAGFVQHPNEWWHFSYGDQLWAWRSGGAEAIYGSCPDSSSIERTI